jgi:hypothetical protein
MFNLVKESEEQQPDVNFSLPAKTAPPPPQPPQQLQYLLQQQQQQQQLALLEQQKQAALAAQKQAAAQKSMDPKQTQLPPLTPEEEIELIQVFCVSFVQR